MKYSFTVLSSSLLKGMRLDEEHLADEAIRRVGPGSNFLIDERVQHILAGHRPAVPEAGVAGLSEFLKAQADGHFNAIPTSSVYQPITVMKEGIA